MKTELCDSYNPELNMLCQSPLLYNLLNNSTSPKLELPDAYANSDEGLDINPSTSNEPSKLQYDPCRVPAKRISKLKASKLCFGCPHCNKVYVYDASLQSHIRKVHAGRVTSDGEMENDGEINDATTTFDIHYPCEHCDKVYSRFNTLRRHVAQAHPEKQPLSKLRRYYCEYCDRFFTDDKLRVEHLKTDHSDVIHNCKIPNIFTELSERCAIHTEGIKKFKCDQCVRVFKCFLDLRKHYSAHTGVKSYCCDMCGKRFRRKFILKMHVDVVHNKSKKYKCHICSLAFGIRSNLNSHMRTHSEERPHRCSLCSAAFKLKLGLEIHMKKHGEAKYQCNVCDKKFKFKNSLVSHHRTHTGERPYTCEVCNTLFADASVLRNHMSIHNSNLTFSCESCGRRFKLRKYLKQHMRVHAKKS